MLRRVCIEIVKNSVLHIIVVNVMHFCGKEKLCIFLLRLVAIKVTIDCGVIPRRII